MITLRWVLGAVAAASVASASTDELQFFSRLLKRQDPGTPEYNCHDNCGKHIIRDPPSLPYIHICMRAHVSRKEEERGLFTETSC